MTLTPDAQARIDDRIRRLAPRRGAAAQRRELASHVADAAEGLAGQAPATTQHVDDAFAALGSREDIRAAFFPKRVRLGPDKIGVALLLLATVLAGIGSAAGPDGTANCSVTDGGSCEASATGAALDVLLWATPPLLVLVALMLAPIWVGLAIAATYLLVAALAAGDEALLAGPSWTVLLLLAAAVATFVAGRHGMLSRRLHDA